MKRATLFVLALLLIMIGAATTLANPLPAPRAPAGNLLKNVSFEKGLNKWTLKNATAKDKVVCNDSGYMSNCAFRFVGKNAGEKTVLTQIITPATAGNGARASVVAFADVYLKPLSGTSCVNVTLTVKFKKADNPALKGGIGYCGQGVDDWYHLNGIGESTSFGENSYKKIILKVKHTGVGKMLLDGARVQFDGK